MQFYTDIIFKPYSRPIINVDYAALLRQSTSGSRNVESVDYRRLLADQITKPRSHSEAYARAYEKFYVAKPIPRSLPNNTAFNAPTMQSNGLYSSVSPNFQTAQKPVLVPSVNVVSGSGTSQQATQSSSNKPKNIFSLGPKPRNARVHKYQRRTLMKHMLNSDYEYLFYDDDTIVYNSVTKNGVSLTDLEIRDLIKPLPILPISNSQVKYRISKHQVVYLSYDLLSINGHILTEADLINLSKLGYIEATVDAYSRVIRNTVKFNGHVFSTVDEDLWRIYL